MWAWIPTFFSNTMVAQIKYRDEPLFMPDIDRLPTLSITQMKKVRAVLSCLTGESATTEILLLNQDCFITPQNKCLAPG